MPEEKKERLKIMLIAGGSLSLIFSLFFAHLMEVGVSFNPLRWILGTFQYGFPLKMLIFFVVLFVALILYMDFKMSKDLEKDDRDFLYSKNGTYGTAKLLRDSDAIKGVARIQPPQYACGTILGQMDLKGKRIINQDIFSKENHRNKHIAVFGASSSGKTFSFVKPFCIQAVRRRESLVITDPKGELYEDTAGYFMKSGYIVRRFDLKNLALSDGWDILSEIRGDPDRADILAKIIWSNISDGSSGGIFEAGPVSLLKAVLLRVALDDKLKDQNKQNIGEAYQMLQNPRGEEFLNALFDPETLAHQLRPCLGPYMSFKQGSPNLRGNMLITLSALLNVFQSDLVRKVTSTNDIDLTLPGKKPCAYFCLLPDMHSTYNFIGAIFFSFLFLDLVDYADNSPGRRCKVPVNFLLDEFANIGSIPEFDKKLATVRSRALNVSIILQDLPQLMGRYPETYKSILSNCATYVCIGCNDPDTATFFSDRAGEATIQVRTDQHEKIEPTFNLGNKHSTGEGKRKIFTTDELTTFGMDECLIVWQALYTMRAYKYPYDMHPEAERMKKEKINASDYPSIMDDEGRRKLREDERLRVEEYNAKLESGWNPLEYFGATMVNVTDEEYTEERKISWYEKAWLWVDKVRHNIQEGLKKIQKNYENGEKEVRRKMHNEEVDSSIIKEEMPDENFTVSATNVESWVYADDANTQAWSVADEDWEEENMAELQRQNNPSGNDCKSTLEKDEIGDASSSDAGFDNGADIGIEDSDDNMDNIDDEGCEEVEPDFLIKPRPPIKDTESAESTFASREKTSIDASEHMSSAPISVEDPDENKPKKRKNENATETPCKENDVDKIIKSAEKLGEAKYKLRTDIDISMSCGSVEVDDAVKNVMNQLKKLEYATAERKSVHLGGKKIGSMSALLQFACAEQEENSKRAKQKGTSRKKN